VIGQMQYTICGNSHLSKCPNERNCIDKILTMPQCFTCFHYKNKLDDEGFTCTIHGDLPEMRGCCGLYIESELEYCFNGWSHRRDWGLDCGLVDTIGCEQCQEEWMKEDSNT
jgi:hypothetical protein